MFMEKFSAYTSEGDSITCEVDGFKCTATIYRDYDIGEPWKEHDGHGPVSEWTTRDKEPGERVLASDRMGNGRRLFYDFAAAVKLARLDGWGLPNDEGKDLTPGQIAERAAEADFKRLKAWCDDEWYWAGIAVTVSRNGIELTDQYDHALWGIDGNWNGESSDYLTEVANDLLGDALEAAKRRLADLAVDSDSVAMSDELYEDERFPVSDWIASGSRLGYLEWLEERIEEMAVEIADKINRRTRSRGDSK